MQSSNSIEILLQDIFQIVNKDSPHLRALFRIFSQEARSSRIWLESNLNSLSKDVPILEVGAGLMLLSCQLRREGFLVASIEPVSEGFSEFSELQGIILAYAKENNCMPTIIPIPVEDMNLTNEFAFAFSVNVMEHVSDVNLALKNIVNSLKPGAEYRFTCPNYLFPYESHFNIPNLFFKKLTERIYYKRIFGNKRMDDPKGVWNSLNWITVPRIILALRGMQNANVVFKRSMLELNLLRVINDEEFSARRPPWIRNIIRILVCLNLHRLGGCIPASVQPTIDCSITRLH